MPSVVLHDLSSELEASLKDYALTRGLTLSEAAAELVRLGLESGSSWASPDVGVGATEYVSETLKEALHTRDEAEEYIRNHEDVTPRSRPV